MENLVSYLNDHLAGSVVALELLDRLIANYQDEPNGPFFQTLRDEVEADQKTLKELIHRIGAQESKARKAGAWITEKLLRGKIELGESSEGELGLLLALEALVLGITGKLLLWRALAHGSPSRCDLAGVDYASLEKRALNQRDRVESERIKVARIVLAPAASSTTKT